MPKGRSRKRKEKGHQSQPAGEWVISVNTSLFSEGGHTHTCIYSVHTICGTSDPPPLHTHTHTHTHTRTPTYTDTGSLDDDSESVCSSLDGSVMSEDGVGVGGVEEETEEDAEFQLAEHIDRLGEKR